MTRREVQAEQTRRAILESARRLFARDGYARTTIAAIARDAGVSPQTIYDSVGSKAELVRQMNNLIDELAGVGALAASLPRLEDPEQLVELPMEIAYRILANAGDIVRCAFDAASVDSELAAIAEEGTRRHRAGAQGVAGRLAAHGRAAPWDEPRRCDRNDRGVGRSRVVDLPGRSLRLDARTNTGVGGCVAQAAGAGRAIALGPGDSRAFGLGRASGSLAVMAVTLSVHARRPPCRQSAPSLRRRPCQPVARRDRPPPLD